MWRSASSSTFAILCLLGALGAALGSSHTPEAKKTGPEIKLREERLGPNGQQCDVDTVRENKGAMPSGVRAVARLHVFSDRPAGWKTLTSALQHRAKTFFCAEGLSYLNAEVKDGAPGYTDIHAVAWVRPTQPAQPAP